MKREFLMLAQVYDPIKHNICGFYASEKLDGVRAYYDGGISRGIAATEIPWANCEKHGRYKEAQYATGLWTRYAQPIQAPDEFLNGLPKGIPLDGELTLGRGTFQETLSCVRSLARTHPCWSRMQYLVFDSPSYTSVFADGRINNTNMHKSYYGILESDFWKKMLAKEEVIDPGKMPFYKTITFLRKVLHGDGIGRTGQEKRRYIVTTMDQTELPSTRSASEDVLKSMIDRIVSQGGEGVMLRRPISIWVPERTTGLLKVKPSQDMEGTVVGYTWGSQTDKGSKLLGMMGSLRLRLNSGVEFDLSGFTEQERRMTMVRDRQDQNKAYLYGSSHPGERVDSNTYMNPLFPVGSKVTFTYRELTRDGIPKEARYLRRAES